MNMEKKKSITTEEKLVEFKEDFAKLNLAEQAFVRAIILGTGEKEVLEGLVAEHGEIESTVSEDWGGWEVEYEPCDDEDCPCND
jgi:hypothetical protein